MSNCLIPEILFQIAPLLDTRDHFSCRQACRLWHTVFTPYSWSTINDYNWPWCNLLKPLDNSKHSNNTHLRGAFNPKARLFQDLLCRHRDHVRHLTINYDSLLLIAFEARFTQLTSLHIRAHFVSPLRYSRIKYDSSALTGQDDPTALRLSRQLDNNNDNDHIVPESIFFQVPEATYHLSLPHAMEFTRKCWTLILDNASTLQSLRIMKNSRQTLLRLAPPSRTRDFPYLRPDSLEFLKAALDKMPRLQELEAGKQAEEYVLQNIGRGRGLEEGFLSRVTSLHYSAMSGYALHTLLHPPKGLGVGDSDDKNSNKNNIELENDNISDNTTVKKLTISNTVSISCLRDLLVAFPHLQELSGARHDSLADSSHQPSHLGSFHASNLDKVIVSNIKYLTDLQHEFQLFRFNIRMPFLKGMGPKVFFRSVEDLMHILQLCPDLETLEVEELCGLDDHLAIAYVDQHTRRDLELSGGGGIDAEVDSDRSRRNAGMDWKIQTLTIQHSQYRAHTIPQLLRRMPNLVRLELGSISAKAVEVIGETCYESLEDVKFHLRSPCFQEMNLLLVKCSRLRSVRGLGLAVLAEDLRRMDEGEGGEGWSCLGVRELQIEIHGVPRLTCRQEEILFKESTASNNNDSTGVSSEDKEEYKEALSQHRTNEAVRHRVLDQLGRLQELRVLDLSFQPLVYKHYQSRFCDGSSQHRKDRIPICDYPVPNSLSLSLSRSPPALHFTVVNKTSPPVTAGLEQLATLKNLEVIGFKAVEHGMGEAEVRWMSEHWPRLRTVLGVSGVLYKGHGTGNINCRCLDADVLPVGIRTLFERWVPGVGMPQDDA